jgi:O-antigen/teichoic acid export membrane protein
MKNRMLNVFQRFVSYILIRNSTDLLTVEGRNVERYRRVILTVITSVIAKGIGILATVITVPLTMNYLGLERYGLWMTINSTLLIMGFADLGIGNGLLNEISKANGNDDQTSAQKYVSSSFFLLSIIAVIIIIVTLSLYKQIEWRSIFKLSSSDAIREVAPTSLAFMICFALNIPLGIVQRVQMGYQEGYINFIWQCVGNFIGLIGIYLAVIYRTNLTWIVIAFSGGPIIASLINWFIQFRYHRPWLKPNIKYFEWSICKNVLGIGSLFFILQVVVTLAFASDNYIIMQIVGTSAVARYSVVQKLFSIGPVIQTLIVTPLWPAYAEAKARNDIKWIKNTFRYSLTVSVLICFIISFPLVLWGQTIISFWIKSNLNIPFMLLLGFGIWSVLSGFGSAVSTFFNGISNLKFQVIIAIIFGISVIVLKIYFATFLQDTGVIWATIISYFVLSAIPSLCCIFLIFKRMD